MADYKQDVIKRFERVVDYIHDNIDGDLSLDTLAEIACYSRFHFQRLYTAVTGESLAQTVKRTRHSRAANSLLKTNASIDDIAKKYGFTSAQSFTHGFRAEMGVSPTKFRKLKLAKWKDNMFNVTIETHPDRRLATIPHKGSYMEIGRVFEQLGLRIQGSDAIDHSQGWIGLYYNDPQSMPEAELESAACAVMKKSGALPEGTQERILLGGKFAELLFKGPYAETSNAWEWLYGKWLSESGETPRDEPAFEIYLNDPAETKPQDLLTKICIPIEG